MTDTEQAEMAKVITWLRSPEGEAWSVSRCQASILWGEDGWIGSVKDDIEKWQDWETDMGSPSFHMTFGQDT